MMRVMRSQTAFVNRVWNAPVMRSFHASVVSSAEGKSPKAPKDETKVYMQELISDLVEDTGLSKKDVHAVLQSLPEVIASYVSKKKTVHLHRIGVFKPVLRKARDYHNPQSREIIAVGDRFSVKIQASSFLKDMLK